MKRKFFVTKRNVGRFIVLSLMLIGIVSGGTAQNRISFKRGRSSATVSGTLAENGSKQYRIRARAGQTLALQISSSSGVTVATRAHSPGTSFEYQLEEDGDVILFVENSGASTKFSLTVTIR